MKVLFMSAITIAATAAVSAKEACYKVVNPQSVIIVGEANSGNVLDNKIEQALSVNVKIRDAKNSENPANVAVTAKSKSLKFSTVATDIGDKRYIVECDGGSLQVIKNDKGQLTLATAGLRGDVVSSDEGCTTGSITVVGEAILAPAQCSK
ncbi:MAG: hypothetical protein ACK41T_10540 [Pseudobdellovibrio sp.]